MLQRPDTPQSVRAAFRALQHRCRMTDRDIAEVADVKPVFITRLKTDEWVSAALTKNIIKAAWQLSSFEELLQEAAGLPIPPTTVTSQMCAEFAFYRAHTKESDRDIARKSRLRVDVIRDIEKGEKTVTPGEFIKAIHEAWGFLSAETLSDAVTKLPRNTSPIRIEKEAPPPLKPAPSNVDWSKVNISDEERVWRNLPPRGNNGPQL